MVDEVDEKPPLTKEERRQRQKKLEQARRRQQSENVSAVPAPAGTEVGTEPGEAPAKRRGRPKRRPITASDLQGLKCFENLAPLLERLHDVGCERDQAGNREFHYDELCLLLLLALFNPVVDSLRGLQQASELESLQERLGVGRVSLGSLSEASRVFDARLLKPIIEELGKQLQPLGQDRRLAEVPGTLTLVDGTLLSALPLLVQAMGLKHETGSGLVKWRLHTHFEVAKFVPARIDVTPDGGGENDERAVLDRAVEADRTYVFDRGYAKFALFNRIAKANSSYVGRLRDNSAWEVIEERPLTEADRAAGVLSDQTVQFPNGKADARLDHSIRVVCVRTTPHTSRGKYRGGSSGPGSDGVLRIATNLLDVPVEILSLIYRFRWTIELFFRFFKQIMGCRHLFFHSQNGIELQAYCAIIACMLISLWTGRKATKRTYEMVCYYFLGLATEAELLKHIEKLKPQDTT